MVDIGSAVGGMFNFSGPWGLIGTIFLILLFALIFLGSLEGAVIYFIWRKTWTEKADIYRLIGGKLIRIRTDRARYKRIGRVGDNIFQIGGKTKRYLGRPHFMVKAHTWSFFERKDGELINFELENIDLKMKKAKVHFLHEDVRMQRLGIEKNLGDAFKKQSWWSKYGPVVLNVIYVLFVTICLVILFTKLVDVADALKETGLAIKEMADAMKGIQGTRPNEVQGSTGLVPALAFMIFRRFKNG